MSRPDPAEGRASVQMFTLEATLLSGPLPESFARKNSTVRRTLLARGDQTLHELHLALAPAFGLDAGPGYEFRLGRGISDREDLRYVPPEASDAAAGPGADASRVALDALALDAGGLTYWLDDGGWWFAVAVAAVEGEAPRGRYPRVTGRVGRNPPRPAAGAAGGSQELGGPEAADTACLVGELHLSRGDHGKAVEAFSRAIELRPTTDAFLGRARAYRALAEADERSARQARDGTRATARRTE
jgi:hypothetical protein